MVEAAKATFDHRELSTFHPKMKDTVALTNALTVAGDALAKNFDITLFSCVFMAHSSSRIVQQPLKNT